MNKIKKNITNFYEIKRVSKSPGMVQNSPSNKEQNVTIFATKQSASFP